jgi:hypothetical protein
MILDFLGINAGIKQDEGMIQSVLREEKKKKKKGNPFSLYQGLGLSI